MERAVSRVIEPREPRQHDIPVAGGTLRVVEQGPADAPALIAVHGITASHLAWAAVAAALPDFRVIAPDLRGRGRSNSLPGPFGMHAHAGDLVSVMDALGIDRAIVAGHSMGAFVAVALADAAPERVSSLVLVDGGIPLAVPAGRTQAEQVQTTLGAALARLSRTFASPEEYREFWFEHPALSGLPQDVIARYADYDLAGSAPELRPATSAATVARDTDDLYGAAPEAALLGIRVPTSFLSTPRGLADETPGLYSPAELALWHERMLAAGVPLTEFREVADVNHYTILMSDAGAGDVARSIRSTQG